MGQIPQDQAREVLVPPLAPHIAQPIHHYKHSFGKKVMSLCSREKPNPLF